MWLLNGLGPLPDRVEVDELAVVLGLVLRPDRLHGLDALALHPEAPIGIGAVIGHLLDVPARAHPEVDATAREQVERGDLAGGDDRISLGHQADAEAKPELLGRRRDRAERDEGIERVRVLARELAAAGIRRLSARRNVRVLGEVERVEATLLACLAELHGIHGVLGREDPDSELHAWPPSLTAVP